MEDLEFNLLIEELIKNTQQYYNLLTDLNRSDYDERKIQLSNELKEIEHKISSLKCNIRKHQIDNCNNHLYIVLAIKIHNNKEMYSLKCVNCKRTLLCMDGIKSINDSKFIYLFNSKDEYYNNNDTLLKDLQEKIIRDFERYILSHSIEETYNYIYNKYNKM